MAIYPSFLHRLDRITLYTYSLPLKNQKERRGILIHDEERNRWAEAAPLPGRSKETFEEARDQLLRFFSMQQDDALYPCVQFAIESLSQEPLTFPLRIPIWVLLTGSREEILENISQAKRFGSTHIKLKISQLSPSEAKKLIEQLDPTLQWRIDCNRAFSWDEAKKIFSAIAKSPKFCIEEPLYDLALLPQFPFPFALDETLEECPDFPIESCPNLSTLILKPMILGGRKGCQPLLDRARNNNLNVIFTGAYESGVGTLQIASFAQKMKAEIEPLGLGTYRFLEEDLFIPRLNFDTDELVLKAYPCICLKYLTRITHGTDHLPSL